MKINEILVESQTLDEGPLDSIGRGVGKVAGGAAKAVGAVAGGVAGLGKAFMKGYRGGKDTVSGDDEEPAADKEPTATPDASATSPAGNAAPAAKPKAKPQSTFGKLNTAAAGGSQEPAADGAAPAQSPASKGSTGSTGGGVKSVGAVSQTTDTPASAAPAAKQPAAQDQGVGGTAYAQAQKAVQSLPPEQQKEIVTMLQSDPKVKAAMSKPAAPKQKAASAGAGAFGAMAKQLGSEKPAAPAAAPAAEPAAEPAAAPAEKPGFLKTATDKIQDRNKKKSAKPSQAEIDADRARIMGVTSDSVIRKGLMVSESFSFFRKR